MNFNALDLNLIRVFDALLRERSVTRAGDRIGLSQPAVSAALGRLRHVFNDQLFVRQGHEMVPTPLAASLAERAGVALREIEAMVRSVRGLDLPNLDRTFTLLGADFFSTLLMPRLSIAIRAVAPRARTRFLDSGRGDVSRLLAENTIDLALERPMEVPDWVRKEDYFRSPFALVAAAGHPALAAVAEGERMPLDIFSRLPHVIRSIDGSMSGMVDEALAQRGLRRDVVLALPHFQAVALAVAASDCIAALPYQIAAHLRDSLRLRLFKPAVPTPAPGVFLYWHSRYDDDPVHAWLRTMVRESGAACGFSDFDRGYLDEPA